MAYFNSRDVAAIALCGALWGVLNSIFAPLFFRMVGLPFLCDLIGFTTLVLAAWLIRKPGAITAVGLVATGINFVFNPAGTHFLGFAAASVVFDLSMLIVGYEIPFGKPLYTFSIMVPISIVSAALAGFIIGTFFMSGQSLVIWGGVLVWAGLHAMGGLIGGSIGAFLVILLTSRKVGQLMT